MSEKTTKKKMQELFSFEMQDARHRIQCCTALIISSYPEGGTDKEGWGADYLGSVGILVE